MEVVPKRQLANPSQKPRLPECSCAAAPPRGRLMPDFALPVDAVLPDIREILEARNELVLVAAPGAGKSTRVPLDLLQHSSSRNRILLLEPRRVAARALAQYMASCLGESPGGRVGLRIRQETLVSQHTRLEVVTGGVLLRLMQEDPALADYGLVIFDEFHERSLDGDLGLALALQGRALFRDDTDPLKIIVMSATLQDETIAQYLGGAPVIRSDGRAWPVTTGYVSSVRAPELVDQCAEAVAAALVQHEGNILVFLPGQREIEQLFRRLQGSVQTSVCVCRLYGALDLPAQRSALAALDPAGPHQRKIILATDIAETSLTIDGITVVIDTGFRREPQFDSRTGMSRLATTRISRASAEQRAGRAGRTGPGHCYRLWPRELGLKSFDAPEIEQADLAPAVLQLLAWGIDQPRDLHWLTPPPADAWRQALNLLRELDAVILTADLPRLTPHGAAMARFPAHPRLAHMMIRGSENGLRSLACRLAAILAETGGPRVPDLEQLLQTHGEPRYRHWAERVKRQAASFEKLCPVGATTPTISNELATGFLLASAYPDRIARRRPHDATIYLMANGRAARLDANADLAKCEWLAVAEVGGSTGNTEDRIFVATSFDPTLLQGGLEHLVQEERVADWDEGKKRFVAESVRRCGAITLSSHRLQDPPAALRIEALCAWLRRSDLSALDWREEVRQWLARVELLRRHQIIEPGLPPWPDLSKEALADSLDQWLAPHLADVWNLADLRKLDLLPLLTGLLSWPQVARLDNWAPSKIVLPSGNTATIDYRSDPPVLAVKLQEMFGCRQTPTVARGQIKVILHLLSPARRPLQITQDLEHFWTHGYESVKKEMRGRYPKHPWPDDPLNALPTSLTKRKLNS